MPASSTIATSPVLELRGLSKTFAGQRVLDQAALALHPGEIHGLIGQNGSGKSTLIKLLAGYYLPDPGAELSINGGPFVDLALVSSNELIGFVHQDLALVPALNVADNLALGREYQMARWPAISWRKEHELARMLLAELGQHVDTRRPVDKLSPVQRTCVAVARALEGLNEGARVLVLDEPTASLPKAEAAVLFGVLRKVAADGVAILYVSHHLDEIIDLTSRVTVLRDGHVVHAGATQDLDHAQIVELILGRQAEQPTDPAHSVFPPGLAGKPLRSEVVLQAVDLSRPGAEIRVSLEVRAGEIVGVAGLDGSGREEVCPLLAGAMPSSTGSLRVAGQTVRSGDVRSAIRSGLAYVPSDRHKDGLIAGSNVRENITISRLSSLVRFALLRRRAERRDVTEWIGLVDLKPPNPEADVFRLSGGNQQKVVLARALRQRPSVLVLDEPTKAVDVGAAAAIWALVKASAGEGAAVVCSSVDPDELARHCSRTLVFRRGRLASVLEGAQNTAANIADESTRVVARSASPWEG